MEKEIIKFGPGRRTNGLAIKTVVKEIERVEKKYGRVTPHDLIEENSKKGTPLYSFFEWNEEKGAENWRLWQARSLIRSIVIEKTVKGSSEPLRLTLFHSASDKQGKAYFSLGKIASDVNLFISAAGALSNQVGSLQRSLDSLNLVAPTNKKAEVKKLSGAVKKVEKITAGLTK